MPIADALGGCRRSAASDNVHAPPGATEVPIRRHSDCGLGGVLALSRAVAATHSTRGALVGRTHDSGIMRVMMELDRRQLIGGALALLATGVASSTKGWLPQAGTTPPDQATLHHPVHQRTIRFPGDPGNGNLYYGAAVMASLPLPIWRGSSTAP